MDRLNLALLFILILVGILGIVCIINQYMIVEECDEKYPDCRKHLCYDRELNSFLNTPNRGISNYKECLEEQEYMKLLEKGD